MSNWLANLEPLAAAWATTLLPRAIEAALLGTAVVLITRFARRLPSSFRYGLLLVALAKFLTPPLPAPWAPRLSLPDIGILAPRIAVVSPAPATRPGKLAVRGIEPRSSSVAQPAGLAPGAGSAWLEKATTTPSSVTATAKGSAALSPAKVPVVAVWLGLAHLAGAAWLLRRRAAHRRSLHRVIRRCRPVGDRQAHLALEFACASQRASRRPRLLASPDGFGPAATGLLEPKIILPTIALERLPVDRLRGVMAHEVAHHRRGDLWVDAAVFGGALVWWFHPVYWLLAREIRRVREDCCDEIALGDTTPASYCQTLIDIAAAQGGRPSALPAGAHGSHAHPLSRRVRRMMNPQFRPGGRLPRTGLAALVLLALTVGPSFSTYAGSITPATAPAVPPQTEIRSFGQRVSWGIDDGMIRLSRGAIDALVERGIDRAFLEQLDGSTDRELSIADLREWAQQGLDPMLPDELEAFGIRTLRTMEALLLLWADVDAAYVRALRDAGYTGITVSEITRLARYEVSGQYIAAFKREGYENLLVDDLVRLKRYGVEPEYAGTYRDAGYDLSVDDLIRLNRYDVDEDAVARLAEAGIDDLSVDDLVRLQRYEVDDDYIRAMTQDGELEYTVDDLVRLSRYDVDSDYAAQVRSHGLDASTDDLLKLRRYEVDPAYIDALRGLGFTPSIDDLVKMQRYGVSVRELEGLAGSGYTGLSVDDVVRLQRYEVTAEWVGALAAATSRRFSVDELLTMKRYDVSAEYVRGLAAVGLDTIEVNDLVRLRRYEVEPEFIRRLQDAGFTDLTVDKIIRLKRAAG